MTERTDREWELEFKRDALQTRVGQLEYELAEFQGKPEAFERLRGLLSKEKQMRKEYSKMLDVAYDERNKAQAKLEAAEKELAELRQGHTVVDPLLAFFDYYKPRDGYSCKIEYEQQLVEAVRVAVKDKDTR